MVYFIGAGPGDPELLTIKAKKIIDRADTIIYAGSLVNPRVLSGRRPEAKVYNSASLCLDQVIALMEEGEKRGECIARVHTGDPAIYGAHREQMDRLRGLGISYQVIPGVSSFLAAAAALEREYTLPQVSQTVILTRMENRTPVPPRESIASLAAHRASMVIFLSVGMIDGLCDELKKEYAPDTPAAVVYKASWEDEKILRGTLTELPSLVKREGIKKTALVMVGDFLGDTYGLSRLYDPSFFHGYRTKRS